MALSRMHDVTEWLRAWGEGEKCAFDQSTPLVYDELRRVARRSMARDWRVR
jgi:hypothetical protein